MNREEVTLLGFEIVAYAGDARSKLLEALNAAQAGEFAALKVWWKKPMLVSSKRTMLRPAF